MKARQASPEHEEGTAGKPDTGPAALVWWDIPTSHDVHAHITKKMGKKRYQSSTNQLAMVAIATVQENHGRGDAGQADPCRFRSAFDIAYRLDAGILKLTLNDG